MRRLSPKWMRSAASAAAVLLAGGAVVLLSLPVARIDPSACDQIRPGMTLSEAEAVIGAKPGWYDGVWGIRTDAPDYQGYKPFWVGSQGEILLELGEDGRVAEATFYPGEVLNQSLSKLVWERLTRNGFGTGRTDLVIAVAEGAFIGLLLACPLVICAVSGRRRGGSGWAYGLCVVGAVVSLAILIMAVGVGWGTARDTVFAWVGAGSSGLVCFAIGSVLTGKRNSAEPASGL